VIKRPNSGTHRLEEGAEKQTKGNGSLFNETAENFPKLWNDMDVPIQESFVIPNTHNHKEPLNITL
jgi:hypothetical protein